MPSPLESHDLVSLVAGEVDAATLAQRHDLTEAEVLRCRSAFLAGLKLASQPRTPRRLRARLAVAAVAVLGTVAFAQALISFAPNSPALASDVNANFNLLKAWLEQKAGPVNSNVVTVSGTGSKVAFGQQTRQMVDLWASEYGLGVQANTQYSRTAFNFAWYRGGTHSDVEFNAGSGGTEAMRLDSSSRLRVGGNRFMLGSNEGTLTAVRGTYDPASGVTGGAGFSVASCGTGCFDVTFSTAFSSVPTIIISANHPTNGVVAGGVVQALVSHPGQNTTTKFRAYITDGQNNPTNWPFSFIALGALIPL